jgi:hypothetical protein
MTRLRQSEIQETSASNILFSQVFNRQRRFETMMTVERVPGRSGKARLLEKAGAALLAVVSVIVGIAVVEVLCRLFLPSLTENRSQWVMYLEGRGTIFQNHGDIFTYLPNEEVRNVNGFLFDGNLKVEYDYRFRTNNLGLVQDTDVLPGRESLLLLGDSFTEGQGAEPWFRLISPEIVKLGFQPVNGGLMGTGFEQWLKLDRYLEANDIQIRKVVVLFISDDYRRPVFNITPSMLRCLSSLPSRHSQECFRSRFEARVESLLPVTYHILQYLKAQLENLTSKTPQRSREAIAELIKLYDPQNIAFVHLPERDEIDGPDKLGLQARRSIQEAGGKLYDGFQLCHLTPLDYQLNDGHPNRLGYAKIASCVNDVIRQVSAETQ